jgi:hypothetical protein
MADLQSRVDGSEDFNARLGDGYDLERDWVRGACFNQGSFDYQGQARAEVSIDASMTYEQLTKDLEASAGADFKLGFFTANASSEFARNAASSRLSAAFIYRAKYQLPNRIFIYPQPPFTPIAQGLLDGRDFAGFRELCGNRYVREHRREGKVYIAVRLDFGTEADKTTFSADVSLGIGILNLKGKIKDVVAQHGLSGSVEIRAFQMGGDVTQLLGIFAQFGSEAVGRCSFEDLSKCDTLLGSLVQYASGSFNSNTINDGNAAVVGYVFHDYGAVDPGLRDLPPYPIAEGVPQARQDARTKVQELLRGSQRAEMLLREGADPLKEPDIVAYRDGVGTNLDLWREAGAECWRYPAGDDCSRAVETARTNEIKVDPAAVSSNSRPVKTTRDEDRNIETVVFERIAPGKQRVFNDFRVDVPDDYVVVGGGAEGSSVNPGHLLTASYPKSNLSGWLVSSKDHRQESPHQIKAYAIGMKVKGLSPVQLRNKLRLWVAESSRESTPNVDVTVPPDYQIVGGGARVNYSGAGALLTGSTSNASSYNWEAWGRDNPLFSNPTSTVTTYAIGLPKSIPGLGVFHDGWAGAGSSGYVAVPSCEGQLPARFALTSCGAIASSDQFLWRMAPIVEGEGKGCRAASKAHFTAPYGFVLAHMNGMAFYRDDRYHGTPLCVDVRPVKGLNAVSVPVRAPDMSVAALFPNSTGIAYGFDGSSLVLTTTLEPGKGYLVWMNADQNSPICGWLVAHQIAVRAGLNLVGGFEYAINIADIRPSGLITKVVDVYGVEVSTLEPGKAYGLYASEDGTLDLP